jgi:hypothetical protein
VPGENPFPSADLGLPQTVTGGDHAPFASFGASRVGTGKLSGSAVLWQHDGMTGRSQMADEELRRAEDQ